MYMINTAQAVKHECMPRALRGSRILEAVAGNMAAEVHGVIFRKQIDTYVSIHDAVEFAAQGAVANSQCPPWDKELD